MRLIYFLTAIIVCAGQLSGGDKPHPYLFGETSFVVAGFIPALNFSSVYGNIIRSIIEYWFRVSTLKVIFCPPGGSIIKNDHKND